MLPVIKGGLKITKTIDYISPSSFFKAEDNPCTFYLQRLNADTKMPYEPQGLPAGDGSAFDYYVKKKLIADHFPEKAEFLAELKESVDEPIKKECFPMGLDIFGFYAIDCLNKEKWADIELWKTFNYKGLPIRVKLDASVWKEYPMGRRQIAFDWKVSGSRSQASPKPYFENKFTLKEGWSGPYSNKGREWYPNVPFELIDKKWATQMAIYNWFLGFSADGWEESHARLHMIPHTKTNTRSVAIYEGSISADFQKDLFNRMTNIWESIQDGSYTDRIPVSDINSCYAMAQGETWF